MGECRDCAYSDRPTYKWPCSSCRDTKDGRSMYCPEIDMERGGLTMATDKLVDFDHVTDYISREAAIDAIWKPEVRPNDLIFDALRRACEEEVKHIPAADVREVVRKPIVGYEGLYFVTEDGVITNADGKTMKQYTKCGKGTCYKKVALYKDGSYKQKYVHRIVAEAFIPNPDNLPVINHKDEDGTNNRVENLEWCTYQYNANYGTARERQREKIIGKKHTESHKKKISDSLYRHYDDGFVGRRVICLETGKVYESVAKAARDLGISEAAVRMSCNRSSKSGYKYTFRDFCPNCGADMTPPSNGEK